MLRSRSIALLLGLLTLLVYLPATSCHFINFDDPDYVTANHFVQNGLTWAGIKWAFSGAHASNWHPLTWLSHMVDCNLFRLNPAGPHLVNILFHAANTGLLFTLIFRLTGKLWPSAFVAALFAWHPLHVESVAWVAERKDVLSTFFTLLSLLSYTRYVRDNRRGNFWLAWSFFALALLSKPMPVTLPLVMLFLDYWPLQRFAGPAVKDPGLPPPASSPAALILEKWPFILLAAASCVVTVLAQHNAVSTLVRVSLELRLENAATAYAAYLGKTIWPLHLAIFYPLQTPIPPSLLAEALTILIGVSLIAWLERRRNPWLIIGWLWFLATLLPVIGLVQVGAQSMADRYSYFPLIGIFLAVAFAAQAVIERFALRKEGFALAAILILGACIFSTENQLRYWHDSETLFNHSLEVADSATAHASLAGALQEQGQLSEATRQYILAIHLDPEMGLAYWNLGKIFAGEGKLELAAVYYRAAVKQKLGSPELYDELGIVMMKLNQPDEALKVFTQAAQLDPADARPHFLMGRVLLQCGQDTNALVQLHQAVTLDPDNAEAIIYLATVLASDSNLSVHDGAEALELARKAARLTDNQQPAALDACAMSYAAKGDFGAALLCQQQAVKLAQDLNLADDIPLMQRRMELYQKGQPWRESFKSN